MKKVKKVHRAVNLLGFELFGSLKAHLLEKIKESLSQENDPFIVFTPNAEQMVQASNNPNFSRYLKQSQVLLPDGASLIVASRLLSLFDKSGSIKERIAGIDVTQDLLKIADDKNLAVLIVGGRNYQQLVVKAKLIDPANGFWQLDKHLFWTPSYQKYSQATDREEKQLKTIFQKLKPAIVLVALGAPSQEEWILQHQQLLKQSGAKIVMAIGGTMDIILGRLNRAPFIMRQLGLEWFFRLIQEPWRWKRQLRLIKFWWLILLQILCNKEL